MSHLLWGNQKHLQIFPKVLQGTKLSLFENHWLTQDHKIFLFCFVHGGFIVLSFEFISVSFWGIFAHGVWNECISVCEYSIVLHHLIKKIHRWITVAFMKYWFYICTVFFPQIQSFILPSIPNYLYYFCFKIIWSQLLVLQLCFSFSKCFWPCRSVEQSGIEMVN